MPLTQENRLMTRRTIVKRMAVGLVLIMALAAVLSAGPKDRDRATPRDVTLTGKIVDLHNVMTGKYVSSDHARCTLECIKAGVPAAIETDDGLVVIGEGTKGPRKALIPLAFKRVELNGKLYERSGIRYIDLKTIKAIDTPEEPTDEEGGEVRGTESFDEESDAPEPDADTEGACCLPDGDCVDTWYQDCQDENGRFFMGSTCDSIECGPEE